MTIEPNNILFAFMLTLFAGLATGLGSALAFFTRQTNTRLLSLALGFSAGVMLYVSFVEILEKANTALTEAWGASMGRIGAVAAFFGGMLIIMLIDRLIPDNKNPHQLHSVEEIYDGAHKLPADSKHDFSKLQRTGMFTALAIAIHNFPEGMATFTAALTNTGLGISIAVAVAIHNIPEGIATSIPIYYATGSRKKAFAYSFLSGLAEPLGAILFYLVLMPFFSSVTFGIIFGIAAGIMVYISLDELLPAAEEYGEHHYCIYGTIAGMMVMAASLIMLA